jgi:20S proteasome subunit beta 1
MPSLLSSNPNSHRHKHPYTNDYSPSHSLCRKLATIRDNILIGRSGATPDAQAVSDAVLHYVDQHEASLSGGEIQVSTVANAASQMSYSNREFRNGRGLLAAFVVAGYDRYNGGQVFGVPLGGTCVKTSGWAVEGSGSTPLWSKFDSEWTPNMSRDEAERFMKAAIALAIARDSGCGGCIRLITVTPNGASKQFIAGNEVPQYLEEADVPVTMEMG